jgi:hypothetical protein
MKLKFDQGIPSFVWDFFKVFLRVKFNSNNFRISFTTNLNFSGTFLARAINAKKTTFIQWIFSRFFSVFSSHVRSYYFLIWHSPVIFLLLISFLCFKDFSNVFLLQRFSHPKKYERLEKLLFQSFFFKVFPLIWNISLCHLYCLSQNRKTIFLFFPTSRKSIHMLFQW